MNGYETVGKTKVVSIDSFKELDLANNANYVTSWGACILLTWLRVAHMKKLRLYLIYDLDNISFLLNEIHDLKK